ncbi:ABC transporter ATP-binding protein [Oceanidesulfovibrio marinus]|uniref:ABC transporter ATP-binding protein n=1 Tax=Oceanidesulfovibrio marinus TaxID=370038 RepID=A0A6P1ZK91_9BACT|nr:ABC transporter ATP-binding protein [Oceanidesulfovibrio marinus]QJT09218.1 ABC transporter ATP-binding protein [Oceanidesulfovibrio marinus]TVM36351.1 high-affinity branched-chain amino acid ABC transporter ATP-binding protein LivG [Oceanidesulfovibrio marinus]
MAETVLSCRDLGVRFGGVVALSAVDFDVAAGSITAVIGPNGAGKTTLFNAVTGLVTPSGGEIRFNGAPINDQAPHKRAAAGLVRTFQNLEIFTNMSVLDNVLTGCHRTIEYGFLDALFKTPRYTRQEREHEDTARRALEFVGYDGPLDRPAGDLPFGGQRALELARAIAASPSVVLLDEPAAGLNMRETKNLGQLIARMRSELGLTIALVEHDMDLVMSVSDEITVLSFGQVLATGTPAEIQQDERVIAAYLGEDDEDDLPETTHEEAGA